MDFNMSERQTEWLNRVRSFTNTHIRPAVPIYKQQDAEGSRWKVIPVLEDLKKKAKAEGLWNMFMPPSSHEDDEFRGAGLSNLEYAPLAEEMGHIGFASEVFNCSAPDTGNMEVFMRYASREQKRKWLRPLMDGEIRSAFLMTEPAVASSDATNIETSIVRDGNHYVINGRKWWSSGVGDPRCKIAILMGKTDPKAARHAQQSQILVPLDTPGITVEKMLPVFGFDDAPHGHAQVLLENVRVPAENILLGEGRGFEIAQGRLGPGRIHHCMRTIGVAEEALEKMVKRLSSRSAFGKKIIDHQGLGFLLADMAAAVDSARATYLDAARRRDVGRDYSRQASVAKLIATDAAMKVTTDAVQVLGGYGYTRDFPVERYMREAKIMQIFEGTNQIQRMVIARSLAGASTATITYLG